MDTLLVILKMYMLFTSGALVAQWSDVACVAGGFKGLGVYGEGNYGERNEKDVYNILRRRWGKLGTRRGEEDPPRP